MQSSGACHGQVYHGCSPGAERQDEGFRIFVQIAGIHKGDEENSGCERLEVEKTVRLDKRKSRTPVFSQYSQVSCLHAI